MKFIESPGALTILAFSILIASTSCQMEAPSTIATHSSADFVPNEACRECHEAEFTEWMGSHHELAMQVADEGTVLGDFNDIEFQYFDLTSRFFRRDGDFYVRTEGADGQLQDFKIAYVFGVDPLQQYLVEFPGGKMQSLTIAWDTAQKRWFHLYPNERIRADDPLHWTGLYQNWNGMCAECHMTNLRKQYDPFSDTFSTTWSEINVSCQACHGPGSVHVEWARVPEPDREAEMANYGLSVDFAGNDSFYQVDSCAPCHSRRARMSQEHRHFEPYLDLFRPELLAEGLYFTDGQILDEVYVYGSFLQSKMYHVGVRCTDCHNPHTLKLRQPGNQVCAQCHQEQPDRRFAGLEARAYDSPSHHFHVEGSAGAQCVNCHMPERTYMVVDPRRDHSFRIPRPELTNRLGAPNACNGCHSDKDSVWATRTLDKWYPGRVKETKHFGEVIAAGRAGDPTAETGLTELAQDPDQPAIVRATALSLLRGSTDASLPVLTGALSDPSPLVRAMAVAGLIRLDMSNRIELITPLLNDPVRLVRIEAARVLAAAPSELLSGNDARALANAISEYEEAQLSVAEMPWAHLNLGVLYSSRGETERAIEAYQMAISRDRTFLPARVNLANLYNQLGRNRDAELQLRSAIRQDPTLGDLHYSLGLLLAEQQRLAEASEALGKAARLMPGRARVRYNYALTLQYLGQLPEAEAALRQADASDPNDPDIVYALLSFYAQQGDFVSAITYAERLVQLLPNDPQPIQVLNQLRQARSEKR